MMSPDRRSSRARPWWLSFALASCTPTHAPPKSDEPVEAPPLVAPPAPVVEAPPAPATTSRQARPRSLAVAMRHACAIEGAGEVACWGRGTHGQLAPGHEEHSARPVRVPGITDAVAVATAYEASCALRAGGVLSCWGRIGMPPRARAALMTSRALGDVVEFGLGYGMPASVCALRRDGTVACASLADLDTVVTVPGIDDAIALEVDINRAFVLRKRGALDSFELPRGRTLAAPELRREEIGEVVDIADVGGFVCALLASGQMQCRVTALAWRAEVPTAGPLWKTKLPGDLWATAIDHDKGEGDLHCVRTAEEEVSCWGDNSHGQLGSGMPAYTTSPRALFVEPMVAVSTGGEVACGVRAGGEVGCVDHRNEEAPEVEGVRALAAGDFHACAIVGAGEARCWGFSDTGALGGGSSTEGLVRVQGLTDLVFIAVADDHSCAARRDHTVSCWGSAMAGQLGDGRFHREDAEVEELGAEGESLHSTTPVVVAGIEGEIRGLALGDEFSCAATTVGLHCWGSLPNPSAGEPARIGAPRVVLPGAVRAVDAEGESLCALDEAGSLHCWGPVAERYHAGAFVKMSPGRDDRDPGRFSRGGPLWKLRDAPLEAKAVAVGDAHACLLSGTGEVWCWGNNDQGQLGDGTTRDRAEPVKVRGLPGPALELAAGEGHTCARGEGNQVLCWGARMGPREHIHSRKPVRVVGLAPRTAGG